MRIIKPSVEFINPMTNIEGLKVLDLIEEAGRVCYKSDKSKNYDQTKIFIKRLLTNGHESVLEHAHATLKIICSRGISHQIVRHRIGSYSQESTRYCNYSLGKFNSEITVIEPIFFKEGTNAYNLWKKSCEAAEEAYFNLLNEGCTPQEARTVLPDSLKTEIFVTYNLRQWRHFLEVRYLGTTGVPHPQMREVARMAAEELRKNIPLVFDDFI